MKKDRSDKFGFDSAKKAGGIKIELPKKSEKKTKGAKKK